MPATIEGFESFMGALGGSDTGYDPNSDYSDTSAFDNAADSSSFQPMDVDDYEEPDYVKALSGLGEAQYGADGRMLLEGQVKEARNAMLGNVLSAAARSLLNANPNYVVDGASAAGDAYRKDLDAANARNIAQRTLKFQEAQVQAAVGRAAVGTAAEKLALKQRMEEIKREDAAKLAIGEASKVILQEHLDSIEEAYKAGEYGPLTDEADRKAARAEANKAKFQIQTAGALFQTGRADLALKALGEAEASLPQHRKEEVRAKIELLRTTQGFLDKAYPGWIAQPDGSFVRAEDQKLMTDVRNAQIRASNASADRDYGQAEESRANAAYKRGLADGSIDAGMSPGDASRIRGAGEDWNEALRTEVNGPMFTSSGKLPRESKLNKYLGPLLDDPNINQVVLMEVIKNSPNPGLALDAIAASGGRMPEQMRELYDDYFDMYKKSLVSGRGKPVGIKFANTGPNNLPRGVRE